MSEWSILTTSLLITITLFSFFMKTFVKRIFLPIIFIFLSFLVMLFSLVVGDWQGIGLGAIGFSMLVAATIALSIVVLLHTIQKVCSKKLEKRN